MDHGTRKRQVPQAPIVLAHARPQARAPQYPDHILHQLQATIAIQGENGFRMKLHRFHRQFAMPHTHDDAVVALRRDFERRRQFLANRV